MREQCDCCYAEESPDSTGNKCWIISSEGDLRESATEKIPPFMVRVKRCR